MEDGEYSSFLASDDDGINSTNSSPYEAYLNSMILNRREEIRKEKKLLSEVCYPVDNFKIITGLSVARGMLPSVKIVSTVLNLPDDEVSLSLVDFDWYSFLPIASKMMLEDVADGCEISAESENFTVSTTASLGQKTLKLKSDYTTLCFCADDIKSLNAIRHLISYQLEFARNVSFRNYYDEVLHFVNSFCDIVNNNYVDIITYLCNLNVNEKSYYMLEMLQFYPQEVMLDLDRINMCTGC